MSTMNGNGTGHGVIRAGISSEMNANPGRVRRADGA